MPGVGTMLSVGVVSDHEKDISQLLGLALDRFGVQVRLHAKTVTEAIAQTGVAEVDIWLARLTERIQPNLERLAPDRQDSAQPGPLVVLCEGTAHQLATALAHGASAITMPDDTVFDLAAAIHAAARRELFVSPGLLRRFDRGLIEVLAVRPLDSCAGAEALSERELRVLEELAVGKSNAGVGRRLHISPATVSTHVGNILRKLGAANRTEAVSVALGLALIEPPHRRAQSGVPTPSSARSTTDSLGVEAS